MRILRVRSVFVNTVFVLVACGCQLTDQMSHLGIALSGGEEQERASGWGLSDDKKRSYGFAWSRGRRSTMEDCYEARFAQVDGLTIGLFGVFDGHGGSQASEYVCKKLFDNLVNHPKLITDTKVAIDETYQQTDSDFLQAEGNQKNDAGSTASTAILVGDRLLVANVGDSRAVICKGGTAYAVSEDHKPSRKDERQRIEDAGGIVIWAGTWRVGGILAVSRAFGDRSLKQFVVAKPDVYEETVDDKVKFLILASDGLWDVVSNQDAVTMVEAIPDAEEAAKSLVEEAICKGSADNVTCIVICFHNGVTEDQNEPS